MMNIDEDCSLYYESKNPMYSYNAADVKLPHCLEFIATLL